MADSVSAYILRAIDHVQFSTVMYIGLKMYINQYEAYIIINLHFKTKYIKMIVQIALLCILLSLYYFVFKPWRLFTWYRKHLQGLGYSVYTHGYTLIGATSVNYSIDQKAYGDPNYSLKNKYYKYDIVLDNFFNNIFITIINPQLYTDSFTTQKLYVSVKSQKLFAGAFKQAFGDSLVFNSSIETWKRKRKILTQMFNFDFLKCQISSIIKITQQVMRKAESQKDFPDINLENICVQLIGSISTKVFLGIDQSELLIEDTTFPYYINQYISLVSSVLIKPQIAIFGPKIMKLGLRKQHKKIFEMKFKIQNAIRQLILQRQKMLKDNPDSIKNNDLINLFLRNNQVKAKTHPNQVYSVDQIIVEIIVLIFASIDTTSHTLQNLLLLVSNNPSVNQKVVKQIDNIIQNDKEIEDYEKLKKLEYFDCVLKQTLRHYGVLNGIFPRQATVDHKIKDICILKGVIVNYWTVPNYYNPKYFQDPQKFYPQRWQTNLSNQINQFVMMHFSAGPRSCLGKQLAHLQIKTIVACLLRKYAFKPEKQHYKFRQGLVFRTQEFKTRVIKL